MSNQTGPVSHEHHVVGPKTYLLILGALMVLTATTTGAAYLDMGVLNPIIALAIACLKAVLVILFFMHIRYSSKVMMLTLVGLHQPQLGFVVGKPQVPPLRFAAAGMTI